MGESTALRHGLWTLGALLSMVVTAYAAAVLLVPGFGPPFLTELRATSMVPLAAHIGGSLIALAIGPWQFSARLRARRLNLHRWMGRIYVVAVIVGGLGGLMLSTTSQEGIVTHLGFGSLAVVWMLSTLRAWRVITRGDEVAHRAWMTRSFALTFAAVTLRIILPLELALGLSFHAAYQIVSWASWLPNLVAAEWLNARRATPVTPYAAPIRTA